MLGGPPGVEEKQPVDVGGLPIMWENRQPVDVGKLLVDVVEPTVDVGIAR